MQIHLFWSNECNVFFLQFSETFLDIQVAILIMFWSFAQIFLFCEFGERLIDRFAEIDNEMFGWNWYKFPIGVQKILPLIMKGTQKPVKVEGFGNIQCARETFKIVRFLAKNAKKTFRSLPSAKSEYMA